MPMTKLGDFAPQNPFHDFICDGCNVRMGDHFIYRPDSRLCIGTPQHDGKFYCHSDKTSWAGAFHQREHLGNLMARGARAAAYLIALAAVASLSACSSGPGDNRTKQLLHECREANRAKVEVIKSLCGGHDAVLVNGAAACSLK